MSGKLNLRRLCHYISRYSLHLLYESYTLIFFRCTKKMVELKFGA